MPSYPCNLPPPKLLLHLPWCCPSEPAWNITHSPEAFETRGPFLDKLALSGLVCFCGHSGCMACPPQPHIDVHVLTDSLRPQANPLRNEDICLNCQALAQSRDLYLCCPPRRPSNSVLPFAVHVACRHARATQGSSCPLHPQCKGHASSAEAQEVRLQEGAGGIGDA